MRVQPAALAHALTRLGVAFAFLYPAIDAWFEPDSWVGYFPSFMQTLPISSYILLHSFGIIEIGIALWLLSGWKIRIPALAAAVILIAIVAVNSAQFPILFRDVAIAAAALGLALIHNPSSYARTSS